MTKTRVKKGDNIEFILDKLNDPMFKAHALIAIDHGISLRKLLRFIGTTYQTLYTAAWRDTDFPRHLKDPTPRFIFCEAVRYAVANSMFSKRYGRGNNYNVLAGIIALIEYNWRLSSRDDPAK